MTSDVRFQEVLAAYEARAAYEEGVIASLSARDLARRRDEFLVGIGAATGTFLNAIVKGLRARSMLEVGSSYGYSTLWLAEAARETGGMVTSLELRSDKAEYARERIARARLDAFVTFRIGDARHELATLTGPWDIVLLDIWKDLYIPCFDLLYPGVRAGGIVVADNMLAPVETRAYARAYRAHVRQRTSAATMLLPIGSGLEFTQKP